MKIQPSILAGCALLSAAQIAISAPNLHQNQPNELTAKNSAPILGGYFQSWSTKWTSDPSQTELAKLPEYVNIVYLSFMRPDSHYVKGSYDLSSTGLNFNYDNPKILKDAIAILKQRHPNTKVIVSVGGATYNNWNAFNAESMANFVSDFKLDGVDIDFESADPGCAQQSNGMIACKIDTEFQQIISSMRSKLPRPQLITIAAWSIGAYGEDQWRNAQPQAVSTGMMLPFFRSSAANDIDMVNVMSYDAGKDYKATDALAAYTHYFKGTINMGVEVPPEAWGGHIYTLSEVEALTKAVKENAINQNIAPGMMIWSLQKKPNSAPTANNPDAQMMVTTICNGLKLSHCSDKLFP